jgi:hypothetical protein
MPFRNNLKAFFGKFSKQKEFEPFVMGKSAPQIIAVVVGLMVFEWNLPFLISVRLSISPQWWKKILSWPR